MATALADVQPENEKLLQMLDKGIDDMLAGRELPLAQAFEKITELRKNRQNAQTQNLVNARSNL